MVLHIGGVSVVLIAIMMFAAFTSILLGRTLSKEEFGEFSLMRTLVLFIAPLAVWGQDIATARFFSKNDASRYRWSQALRTIMSIGAPITVVAIVLVAFVYDISYSRLAALLLASLAYLSTLFFSNLVRSRQRYGQAILMLNGFRGAFFLVACLLFSMKSMTANPAILSYYGLIVLWALFNARYAFRHIEQGSEPVPRQMHTTGLLFMGSQASTTLIGSLDSLLIPALLDLSSLALYQAAIVPAQIFNILGHASKYVWVPEFGRSMAVQTKKLSLLVALVALLMLTAMVIAAKPILHIMFAGKYDHGAAVLQILVVAGAIRLLYNLSSSIITGRMAADALGWHLGITFSMVLVEVGLLFLLLKNFGVIGAAVTMLVVTALRTVGSYILLYKFRHQLRDAGSTQ
ncbi:oligosaccharide flippase family protein [candidate division KSB1 bacterium]|nr:oligosaccharide flippase family protein [candidate division KSB1 bacterium]